MENAQKKIKQILLIEDRKRLELNDVVAILSFDEEYISLETSGVNISVEGNELKIIDLSKETGHISITGSIYSVTYSDGGRKKRGGLFR